AYRSERRIVSREPLLSPRRGRGEAAAPAHAPRGHPASRPALLRAHRRYGCDAAPVVRVDADDAQLAGQRPGAAQFHRTKRLARFGRKNRARACWLQCAVDSSGGDGVDGALHLPLKDARQAWTESFESIYMLGMLKRTAGKLTRAAELADVNRRFLQRLVARLGLHAKATLASGACTRMRASR